MERAYDIIQLKHYLPKASLGESLSLSNDVHKVVKRFVGEVLNISEAALPAKQFNAFKKLIWTAFHERMRPEISKLLREQSQVRAVPTSDSFDGKGGA